VVRDAVFVYVLSVLGGIPVAAVFKAFGGTYAQAKEFLTAGNVVGMAAGFLLVGCLAPDRSLRARFRHLAYVATAMCLFPLIGSLFAIFVHPLPVHGRGTPGKALVFVLSIYGLALIGGALSLLIVKDPALKRAGDARDKADQD
jgi:hypothetical protein